MGEHFQKAIVRTYSEDLKCLVNPLINERRGTLQHVLSKGEGYSARATVAAACRLVQHNIQLDKETFAYHLMEAIKTYIVNRGKITPEVAVAWGDDLLETDDLGNTFSILHNISTASEI